MFPGILMKAACRAAILAALALFFVSDLAAQAATPVNVYKSQEISEVDGVPVLMKHLPDYDRARPKAVFPRSVPELKAVLGERPVLDEIDFTGGTEAVVAPYDAGKLLIVEFTSPQGSVDADQRITTALGGDPSIAYRRIGNYNALVFDVTDAAAAGALLDQVKYEKKIQWLGENPFHRIAERNFITTTTDIFLSTVMVIVIGIGFSVLGGLVVGYAYFMFREKQRAHMGAFTDAGGMTRLNLDGFTPDISPDRLLGE